VIGLDARHLDTLYLLGSSQLVYITVTAYQSIRWTTDVWRIQAYHERAQNPIFRGLDDEFFDPHSRHTKIRTEDILKVLN
jgi:homoserine O-succinyltransferase